MNSKPRTIVINSRCDIRSLATLHRYWYQKGVANLNMSQLLRLSVDNFADLLIENSLVKPFDSTLSAVEYIDHVKLSIPAGNRTSLLKQIQRETLISDGFDTNYMDNVKTVGRPSTGVADSLVSKARKMMKSAGDDPETPDDAQKRRNQEFEETKKQLGIPPKER